MTLSPREIQSLAPKKWRARGKYVKRDKAAYMRAYRKAKRAQGR